MTKIVLCERCGVHEVEGQSEFCKFCLCEEEDFIDSDVDVETQMRRSVGRRILEGFEILSY